MVKNKSTPTWVPLLGHAIIEGSEIRFRGDPNTAQPMGGMGPAVLLKSDIMFQSGEVTFETKLEAPEDKVQLVLNTGQTEEIFIGLNIGAVRCPSPKRRKLDGDCGLRSGT
jgi:hypothetical protein